MRSSEKRPPGLWFPFTSDEVQVAFGAYGFGTTCLALSGVTPALLAVCTTAFVVVAYLSGLLVYRRRWVRGFEFIDGGAVGGRGYLAEVEGAEKSLLLMHVDDDPPDEELLATYGRLLRQGVQLRRIIFIRSEQPRSALDWVVQFGDREGLQQRVILPEQAETMRITLVIVDSKRVAVSIPGDDVADGENYSSGLALRHLLVIRDQTVAEGFEQMHAQLWGRALELNSVQEIKRILDIMNT